MCRQPQCCYSLFQPFSLSWCRSCFYRISVIYTGLELGLHMAIIWYLHNNHPASDDAQDVIRDASFSVLYRCLLTATIW